MVDRNGRPVTGLTQNDFAVFEDDVRQVIAHFAEEVLEAGSPGPALSAGPDLPSFDGSPQQYRVFLVVLGAGALGSRPLGAGTQTLADPSDALGGLLEFMRTRLLPQDQVALVAVSRYVKVVVYNFNADLVGSTVVRMRLSASRGLQR